MISKNRAYKKTAVGSSRIAIIIVYVIDAETLAELRRDLLLRLLLARGGLQGIIFLLYLKQKIDK